ncbi:hypothetical protein GQ600_15055 [Phytophthora cactorum]|nr:hypothetical protein GQ600_15055 [Phytophthora cactorum]
MEKSYSTSQRHNRGEDFRSWNSKKSNAKGVTIDFGDLQVTYGKGAICGIDDFYSSPPARGRQEKNLSVVTEACELYRLLFVILIIQHSQESTTVILLAKVLSD